MNQRAAQTVETANSLTDSQEAAQRRRGAFMIRLNLILGLLAALAVAGAFTAMFKRPYPAFIGIPVDDKGQRIAGKPLIGLRGLAAPIRNTRSVASWAGRVATLAYTYNYLDFDQRMASLRGSFTAGGWNGFTAAQAAANLPESLIASFYHFNASLARAPVVTQHMMMAGVMTYQVEVPINVTFYNTKGSTHRPLLILMTVEHVPTVDNPRGLGVVNFIERSMSTGLAASVR